MTTNQASKTYIQFFDTSLRDGEQTIGVNFSTEDKIQIAHQVADWGADVIEAGFPAASPTDFQAVRRIGQEVTNANIVGLARCVKRDIDAVVKALADAPNGQIHVFIGTSPIHREAKFHMNQEQVLAKITECVSYAKQSFTNVEFSPEDATRTEWDFLARVCQTAIEAGATVINLPDTVGYTYPAEFGHMIDYLHEHVPSFDQVTFSVHCHNDLGMATANAIMAIQHGVTRIEGTINGIGERAGNTPLEEVAAFMHVRQDQMGAFTNGIDLKQTAKTCQMISDKTGMVIPNNKAVTGANAFAHESGIHQDGFLKNRQTYEILTPQSVGRSSASLPLGKLSGSHAVINKLKKMGYEVADDQIKDIYQRFQKIADHQKIVSETELVNMMQQIG